jgi:hypothetical protein
MLQTFKIKTSKLFSGFTNWQYNKKASLAADSGGLRSLLCLTGPPCLRWNQCRTLRSQNKVCDEVYGCGPMTACTPLNPLKSSIIYNVISNIDEPI